MVTSHPLECPMNIINQVIQPFQAEAYQDGEFVTVTEETLQGRWSVLFFYPADFTFVCPTELEDLADHQADFDALGVDIYSVSTDTHFAHKAWHDTSDAIQKVKYTMLADPSHALSRQFQVLRANGLADRGTFLLDPQGVVQVAEIHAEGVGRDASELLRKIKAAQYVANHPGEVCPAKWKEGQSTLRPSLDLVGKI